MEVTVNSPVALTITLLAPLPNCYLPPSQPALVNSISRGWDCSYHLNVAAFTFTLQLSMAAALSMIVTIDGCGRGLRNGRQQPY